MPRAHALQTLAPASEKVPAEHDAHALAEVAPSTADAVPDGQRLHDG